MAEIVRMPKLSDTMTEGVVSAWHKKVGDAVKSGEVLAEIETDKATMEFESFTDGVLLHIGVEKGKSAAVDSVLAVLGKAGEDITALLADAAEAAPAAETPRPEAAKGRRTQGAREGRTGVREAAAAAPACTRTRKGQLRLRAVCRRRSRLLLGGACCTPCKHLRTAA
jgi:pyruvate dehydrogenase E2 component (dihydrolipoamide acetyltransferase)